MPQDLPDTTKKEVFETHVGEDLVWMVDNHLQACGWMEVNGNLSDSDRTICSVNIDVDCNKNTQWVHHCENPPQAMAPFVVLSYDIESQPHEVPGQTETLFPEPDRDPILCIGVSVFNMVDLKQ